MKIIQANLYVRVDITTSNTYNSRMDFSKYTALSELDILGDFRSSVDNGLQGNYVTENRKRFGPNVLVEKKLNWLHILIRQFQSPFVYLLILAAILAIFLGEKVDGIIITLFVLMDAFLGFYQEYKSEKAVELLKNLVVSRYRVIRDGVKVEINSEDIVPGDILILLAGDIIPADVRFIKAHDLAVNESVLTGESVEIFKMSEKIDNPVNQLFEAKNMGFSGTRIVSGKAVALVLFTGSNTEIGRISKLSQDTFKKSIFEKETSHLSLFILKLVAVTLVIVLVLNFIIEGSKNFTEMLIFSIALAVSVIPEALPVVTTFSLSKGAVKLAKNKVVVKRLSAVEDLGGIEILCTDKTGTLTENKLTIAETYSQDEDKLLFYSSLASTLDIKHRDANNAFDIAIFDKLSESQKELTNSITRIDEIPFDPNRKKNSVLVKLDNSYILIVRGAPEELVNSCSNIPDKTLIERWMAEKAHEGKRSIGIAFKKLSNDFYSVEDENRDLNFVGLLSFVDQIKQSTPIALVHAKKLGIQVKILTGDSKEVAGYVGKEIGLIESSDMVLTGKEIDTFSSNELFEKCYQYHVFARLSPDQKFKIITALQTKYETGFLGEGINDGPALKVSNVGLVVNTASDIARESADVILLNKSLDVIINGVKEGRAVFVNTTKYIKATLASNFGNFYAVALSTFFVNYLPMLPIQLLLLNLVSDFPMISMGGDTVDEEDILKPTSFDIKEFAVIATLLGIVSTVFDLLFFAIFSRQGEGILHTSWFIGSALTELVFIYSIRTKKVFFKAKRPSPILMYLTIPAIILTVFVGFTSVGQQLFKFVPLSYGNISLIFLLVVLYFICTEIMKLTYYRFRKNTM